MNATIGAISLNISFFLYLFLYVPQIIHNRQIQNIRNLSLWMHFLLFSSYLLDLFYGFASQFQWQYKTVSIVGLTLMIIQHYQLLMLHWRQRSSYMLVLNIIIWLIIFYLVFDFFVIKQGVLSAFYIAFIGYISRAGYVLYCIPQIIKNSRLKSANAISIKFMVLNFVLSILDTISAWCLDWGWPNKLAAPIMVALMVVMLMQVRRYFSLTSQQTLSPINSLPL